MKNLLSRSIAALLTLITAVPAMQLQIFADEVDIPAELRLSDVKWDADTTTVLADVTYNQQAAEAGGWVGVAPADALSQFEAIEPGTVPEEPVGTDNALAYLELSEFKSGAFPGLNLGNDWDYADYELVAVSSSGGLLDSVSFTIAYTGSFYAEISNAAFDADTRMLTADVTFGMLPAECSAWIGLVPSDTPHDEVSADQVDTSFLYLRDFQSGAFPGFYLANEVGAYDLRIYADDNGGEELASVSIDIPERLKESVRIKNVSWNTAYRLIEAELDMTGVTQESRLWMDWFPSDTPDEEVGFSYGRSFNIWEIEGGLYVKQITDLSAAGSYDVRIYDENKVCIDKATFEVPAIKTYIDEVEYEPVSRMLTAKIVGENVPVNPDMTLWVGMFSTDEPDDLTAYDAWVMHVNDMPHTDVGPLQTPYYLRTLVPEDVSGKYTLRLFSSGAATPPLDIKPIEQEIEAWGEKTYAGDGYTLKYEFVSSYSDFASDPYGYDGSIVITDCVRDAGNTGLVDVVIPAQIKGRNVTQISGSAFTNLRNSEETIYTDSDGITHVEYGAQLRSLVIPSTVLVIGDGLCSGQQKLVSVTFEDGCKPAFGDGVFRYCEALEEITLPVDTGALSEELFMCCYSLRSVNLAELKYLTEIPARAFEYTALNDVTLPENVTAVGDSAFSASRIKTLTLPDSVKTIGDYAFYAQRYSAKPDANAEAEIERLTGSLSAKGSYDDEGELTAMNYYDDNGDLLYVKTWDNAGNPTLSDASGIVVVSLVQHDAFTLESIRFGSGVEEIGYKAFAGNESLKTLNLPDSLVKLGTDAFYSCKALKEITFPQNTAFTTLTGFRGCTALPQSILSGIPRNINTLGEYAFAECSFTALPLPSHIRTIGDHAFAECRELKSVVLPEGLTGIGESAFEMADEEHTDKDGDKRGLTAVTLPKSLTCIGEYAFSKTALKSVTVPGTVRQISAHAFGDCENLAEINLGYGVTTIGDSAFAGCEALKEADITLPETVTFIGSKAFAVASIDYDANSPGLTLRFLNPNVNLKIKDETAGMTASERLACYSPIFGYNVNYVTVYGYGKTVSGADTDIYNYMYLLDDNYYGKNYKYTFKSLGEITYIKVSGKVTPNDATVTLKEGEAEREITLKADGSFSFEAREDKALELKVQRNGYYTAVFGHADHAGDWALDEITLDEMPFSYRIKLAVSDSAGNVLQSADGLRFTVRADKSVLEENTDYTLEYPYLVLNEKLPITEESSITVSAEVTNLSLCRGGAYGSTTPASPYLKLVLPVWGDMLIHTSSAYTGGQLIMLFDASGALAEAGYTNGSDPYETGKLPPGEYTVIAMNRNSFSTVFATLSALQEAGYTDSDYAKGTYTVKNSQRTEVTVSGIPVMTTVKFETVANPDLCSVWLDTDQPIAGVKFRAYVSYAFSETASGKKNVAVNLPRDASVVSVYNETGRLKEHVDYTLDSGRLTVYGTASSGRLYLDMSVKSVGMKMLSTVLKSGTAQSPGADLTFTVRSAALTLPKTEIDVLGKPFTAQVKAAPLTDVSFYVAGQLQTTVKTDKLGFATASLMPPEKLIPGDMFAVRAQTAQGSGETDNVTYYPNGTDIKDLHFVQHGNVYTVCENGNFKDDLYYVYINNGEERDRNWSFSATINSAFGIDHDTVTVVLEMKDGSTMDVPMYLKRTEAQKDGTTDYTYTGMARLVQPESHNWRADRIPVGIALEYYPIYEGKILEYWKNNGISVSTDSGRFAQLLAEIEKNKKEDADAGFSEEFVKEYKACVKGAFTELWYWNYLEGPDNATDEEKEKARAQAEEQAEKDATDITSVFTQPLTDALKFVLVREWMNNPTENPLLSDEITQIFGNIGIDPDGGSMSTSLKNEMADMAASIGNAMSVLSAPGLLDRRLTDYNSPVDIMDEIGMTPSQSIASKYLEVYGKTLDDLVAEASSLPDGEWKLPDLQIPTAEELGISNVHLDITDDFSGVYDVVDQSGRVVATWDLNKGLDKILSQTNAINSHDMQALNPDNKTPQIRETPEKILSDDEEGVLESIASNDLVGIAADAATTDIGSFLISHAADAAERQFANYASILQRNIALAASATKPDKWQIAKLKGAWLGCATGQVSSKCAPYLIKGGAYAVQVAGSVIDGVQAGNAAIDIYRVCGRIKDLRGEKEMLEQRLQKVLSGEGIIECKQYENEMILPPFGSDYINRSACVIKLKNAISQCEHNINIYWELVKLSGATATAHGASLVCALTGVGTLPALAVSAAGTLLDILTGDAVSDFKAQAYQGEDLLIDEMAGIRKFCKMEGWKCCQWRLLNGSLVKNESDPKCKDEDVEWYYDENGTLRYRAKLRAGLDPSGTVYEAVESNTLAGVKAEVWYSPNEDGSDAVLWDAENYNAQVNPQITGENGAYEWYVPDGFWQVRFTKDGYADTQTDWMEVPPPRMLLTTAMVSETAPEIARATAYPDYTEIVFTQYMDTLAELNVPKGSTCEWADITPVSEGSDTAYAKVLHIIPAEKAAVGDTVNITLSGAKNYAGTAAEDYTGKLTVETRPAELVLNYTAQVSVQINETPSPRATVRVLDSEGNPMPGLTVTATAEDAVYAIVTPSAETDADGIAHFDVAGELPGETVLTFAVDGTTLSVSLPLLVTNEENRPSRPTAVIGDQVFNVDSPKENYVRVQAGEQMVLNCDTEGAVIYYTTDGTCPCQNTASRMEYTGPVTLEANAYYRIAAYKDGQDYSERLNINVTTEQLAGDLNSDGVVSVADAVILSRYIAEDNTLPAKQITLINNSDAADLNGDHLITAADVRALMKQLQS